MVAFYVTRVSGNGYPENAVNVFMLYISVYTHVEYMYLCYGAQNVTLKPGLMAME